MTSPSAATNAKKLHIVMFPWSGFGHLLNFLNLSKFIAQKGHKVSFVSTPRNIDRLLLKTNLDPSLSSLITFVRLMLPRVDGLPENAEATMDVGRDEIEYLTKAIDGLEPQLTRFLEAESPDWIVYDFNAYWVPCLAVKLGISRVFFMTGNAWILAFIVSSPEAMINGTSVRKTAEEWLAPPPWIPFPSKVRLLPYELNMFTRVRPTASDVSPGFRLGTAISGCDAIFIRHCMEFEPEWVSLLEKLYNKTVIPVGLIPPSVQDSRDDSNETWLAIKEWLDTQHTGSVVYVAMGSEVPLSQDQLTEMALGLELSGQPFFWALRKLPALTESISTELPNGFLERTKGRGMVWTSWAPQLKIMGHAAVGGFLTHCGWGSIVEGLMFGHPLIMLPFFGDQGPNARVLVDKKLGIEVPRNEVDGSFTRNSIADSLSLVMAEEEGRIYREKVKEISTINADRELHNKYIDCVVNYLETHRHALAEEV